MILRRRTACMIVTLGSIAVTMLALLQVPLFYDEIALRIRVGRGLIEGFSFTSYFPECKAAAIATPWLLLPAHRLLSWWDQTMGWQAIRLVPLFAVMAVALLTSLLARRADQPRSLLLLCGGFVGVAGTSFILSRPEYLNLWHVAAILLTFGLARRPRLGGWLVVSVVGMHVFVVTLSLIAHQQALLLVPFSFVACMQLLRGRAVAACIVGFLLAASCMQSFDYYRMNCPGDPALARAMAETQGSGVARLEASKDFMQRMAHRGYRYVQQFVFRDDPQSLSMPLPPVTGTFASLMNGPVVIVVVGHALLLGALLLILGRDRWNHYCSLQWQGWRTTLNLLANDGRFLLLCAAGLLVFYSLYEVSGAFYRAHFRNFLTALLLALAAGHVVLPRARRWLTAWAVFVVLTCLGSAALLWWQVVPGLKAHAAPIGVPLDQDWAARQRQVDTLAARCGLDTKQPGLIVDDLTYALLRSTPQPYGFNYLWYGNGVKGIVPNETPLQREARIRALGLPGMLVQCSTALPVYGMPITHRLDDLCCKAYR